VDISGGPYRAFRPESDFLEAAKTVGYPEVKDLQNLDANNGFERYLRYVTPEGRRDDAAHAYVHPKLQNHFKSGEFPGLHVLVEHKIVRVLFDSEKRACGVEFTPNSDLQPVIGTTMHPTYAVRARRLVVVSCGACGTPSVLERSGVGNTKVLKRAGVPVVADVPGVGHDYQDHNLVLYPYKTALEPPETLDEVFGGWMDREEAMSKDIKILGWNGIDVIGKIRPTEEDVAAAGSGFREAWDQDFKNNANKPLMLVAFING
jgi:alcohol oxidase